MGFKTVTAYNEERFGEFFLLRDDGDYADVVFLYQSINDVLVADVHYIKSSDYSGYAHCCGTGCPACGKGIRVQNKLFIPVFNIGSGKIEFFDRSTKFEPQLQRDVFANYPNPSEYVFRITRHGETGSMDTTYEVRAVGKNSSMPYAKILARHNAQMPAYYEKVCRDLTPTEMSGLLSNGAAPTQEYNYIPTPRASAATSDAEIPAVPEYVPEMSVPTVDVPTFSEPPVDLISAVQDDSTDDLGDVNF